MKKKTHRPHCINPPFSKTMREEGRQNLSRYIQPGGSLCFLFSFFLSATISRIFTNEGTDEKDHCYTSSTNLPYQRTAQNVPLYDSSPRVSADGRLSFFFCTIAMPRRALEEGLYDQPIVSLYTDTFLSKHVGAKRRGRACTCICSPLSC